MSATDVRPNNSSAVNVYPQGQSFSGAPTLPEGQGGGYNGLVRTQDYVTPIPTGNTTGGAVAANGGNLSITDALQTGLDVGGTFTLEGWTIGSLPSLNNTRKCILSKLDSSGGYEVNWWRNGGGAMQFEFLVRQDSSTIGSIAPLFTAIAYDNTLYHHFAFVFQGGTSNLYIDGVGALSTGTLTSTSAGNSASSFLIANNPGLSGTWIGTPSNFRVWNTARTQAQIIADMRNDNPSSQGNLVGFWKLGSNSNDSSSKGNNLTSMGSISFGTSTPFAVYGSTTRYYGGTPDGLVQTQGSASFAAARNATTGNAVNNGGTGGTVSDERIFGPLFSISRVGLAFNTTNATSGIVKVGAHVYVQPASGTSAVNNPSLDVDKFSPASGTGIALSDFGSVSGTAGALAQKAFVGGVYGYLEFGTPALSWVNMSGTTNIALRTGNDINNTAPGGINLNQYIINMNETSGTTLDPFLDVVTVPR